MSVKQPVKVTVLADFLFFLMIFSEINFNMGQSLRMAIFGIVSIIGIVMIFWSLAKEVKVLTGKGKTLVRGQQVKSTTKTGALFAILFSVLSLVYVGRFFFAWLILSLS